MTRRADTGKYEIRWRENGRNRSKSFTLKADADRFKAEVRRARELGRPLDLDRGKGTLADFIGVYWRRYAVPELAEKTRRDYGGVWGKHIRKALGGYGLRDVTPEVVDEFKAKLRAGGVQGSCGRSLRSRWRLFGRGCLRPSSCGIDRWSSCLPMLVCGPGRRGDFSGATLERAR